MVGTLEICSVDPVRQLLIRRTDIVADVLDIGCGFTGPILIRDSFLLGEDAIPLRRRPQAPGSRF